MLFFKSKKNYFGVGLYGNESACQDIDSLTEYVIELFEKTGFTKKQIKASFIEDGDEPISYPRSKTSFSRFSKLVKKHNYKGLGGFTLLVENPKRSFYNDVVLRVGILFKNSGGTRIIITTEKRILFNSFAQLLEWSKQMHTFFHYNYGIIYEKKTSIAATLYGIGLIKESFWRRWKYAELQLLWDQSQYKTEQGYFRDIYPWNLLNQNHLQIVLDGKTLAEHIQDSPKNWGSLQSINEQIWLWTLTKKQIKSVKKVLLTYDRILIVY